MDDTDGLLGEREAQGLQWFLAAMIATTLLWAVGGAIFISSSQGKFFVFFAGLAAAGVDLLLLWMIRRRRAVTLCGLLTVMVALLMIAPSPFLEWQAAGVDAVAAAYVSKTGLPGALVICALSAMTLHPRYPLIVTGLTLAYQGFALAFALDDPRTLLAVEATWEQHLMGDRLHIGRTAYSLGLTAAAGLAIALVAWVARRTVRRAVRLEKANGQLRRYFSPEVAEQIATADRAFLQPGGRLREVVVLVSDIAGFTRLSADLGPDRTVRLLADYQARMTAAIFEQGGAVDKFIGDGILATFGATGTLPDACGRAVAAAGAMCRALDDMNAARGGEPVRHRIGIHAGEALVGNVGSEDRLEFTVIGDVVNLATRIEAACKTTGDRVLVSRSVLEACGDLAAEARGAVPLPGVTDPPELFAPAEARS